MPQLRSPHDREIARLALPAFATLVTEPLYVLADTAVVGHLGTPQLAGLSVASSVLLTLFGVFVFLAYGTTAAVSRLLGAGDERVAAHQAVQSLWLASLIGVAVAVVGWALAEPLLEILGANGAVHANALAYLRISLLGVPSMLIVFAGTGYLRGLQDTRTPFLVAAGTVLVNLLLELVLVYRFDQGIGASALSTVVAQTLGAAIYVRQISRAATAHGADRGPHFASLRALARVGGDLVVRTAALRLALAVETAVATRIGTVDVAANHIGLEVWTFLAFTLDAIAIAGQALVGRALGAGDSYTARSAGRRMIELGVAAGTALAIAVLATRTALPWLFTDDAAVAHLAAFLLVWVAILQPVNAVAFVLDGILIGAGDLRFLARAMVGAAGAFVVAALGVLAVDLGIGSLWAALGLLMLLRAVVLLQRFAGNAWIVLGAAQPQPA